MLKKAITSLSMVTNTGIDTLRSMPVFDLSEIMEDVAEVSRKVGKK